MKKYSKVLSLALAFVMLFALCACGAAETPAAEPTAAPAADAPASEAPAETEAPAESQGVLDQIKADGVLYVTLSPTLPRWSLSIPPRTDRSSTSALT